MYVKSMFDFSYRERRTPTIIDVGGVVYRYLVGDSHDGRLGYWCTVRTVHECGEGQIGWRTGLLALPQDTPWIAAPSLYNTARRKNRWPSLWRESKRCCFMFFFFMSTLLLIDWLFPEKQWKIYHVFHFCRGFAAQIRVWYVYLSPRKPFRGYHNRGNGLLHYVCLTTTTAATFDRQQRFYYCILKYIIVQAQHFWARFFQASSSSICSAFIENQWWQHNK